MRYLSNQNLNRNISIAYPYDMKRNTYLYINMYS